MEKGKKKRGLKENKARPEDFPGRAEKEKFISAWRG
jgi:hypothetical protein